MQPSVAPNRVRACIAGFSRPFLVVAVGCSALSAQFAAIAVDSQGRPVREAVLQLQKLASIPIHYEDLQYYFAADLQAAAPNSTAVVPRGGSFSVNVPVDPAGKAP